MEYNNRSVVNGQNKVIPSSQHSLFQYPVIMMAACSQKH